MAGKETQTFIENFIYEI